MAHKKAAGAAKRTVNVAGKRLGFKKFAGEFVKAGNIILRQRGTKFHPGNNTKIGRDHTVFATVDGFVAFRQMTGYKRAKKWIDVLPQAVTKKAETKAATKPAAKAEVAEVKAEKKTPAKKTTAKKPANK